MTAPDTPPQDVHAAALALAVVMTGMDLDGAPVFQSSTGPGGAARRRLQLLEAFAAAIVDEASRRATLSAIDAWAKERKHAEEPAAPAGEKDPPRCLLKSPTDRWFCSLPPGHPGAHSAYELHDLGQELLETWGETWDPAAAPPRLPAAEQEIERLRDALDAAEQAHEHERSWRKTLEGQLAGAHARIAELEEHARKQHALDGERLRDMLAMVEGCETWRGLSEAQRQTVCGLLDCVAAKRSAESSQKWHASSRALRALAPDPDAACRRAEQREAWTDNNFPVGKAG